MRNKCKSRLPTYMKVRLQDFILVTTQCNFQQKYDLTNPFSVFIIVKRRPNIPFYCTEMRCISVKKKTNLANA
jgi:hypothetical protein